MAVTVGIDRISFYTPPFYLPMATLAKARGIDPDKLHIGLGQRDMAVLPPDESVVTMAAHAAEAILDDDNKAQIDTVLFATESGVDQSKAAGIFVHHLLDLPKNCRVLELKQACYSATAAIQMAVALIHQQPDRKILVIASDVARYGLQSAGEPSQGCGSVALLLSANPAILAIEPYSGYYTQDVMDFWRPNYRDEALVEGKYSCQIYLQALAESWDHYCAQSKRQWRDHDIFLYHTPFPRLAEKAHQALCKHVGLTSSSSEETHAGLDLALQYSRTIGNCYTGSLYLSLASLLDHQSADLSGQRVGLYSYGSGCVAEFFSGILQPGYQAHLLTAHHRAILKDRKALSINEYEQFYRFHSQQHDNVDTPHISHGRYRFAGVDDHKPQYQRQKSPSGVKVVSASAPGKLILSGEHAVVHGAPALVIAVERYTKATVSSASDQKLSFHLPDVGHIGSETFHKLHRLKTRLQEAHGKFRRGERGISDIIQKPFELLQYTAANALDKFATPDDQGFHIHTESNLPIGCGMGSSAASIISANYAIAHYLGKTIDDKTQYQLGLRAENLQHGYSSGIDLHVAIHGGCHLFQNGQSTVQNMPADTNFYIVNTGAPDANTGQCVTHSRQCFQQQPDLLEKFVEVTQSIAYALQSANQAQLIASVRLNHRLLVEIGVVPAPIQQFIKQIEEVGGAAKVCGAGSVKGEKAGIVWLIGDDQALQTVAHQHGFSIETLHSDYDGVKLI